MCGWVSCVLGGGGGGGGGGGERHGSTCTTVSLSIILVCSPFHPSGDVPPMSAMSSFVAATATPFIGQISYGDSKEGGEV